MYCLSLWIGFLLFFCVTAFEVPSFSSAPRDALPCDLLKEITTEDGFTEFTYGRYCELKCTYNSRIRCGDTVSTKWGTTIGSSSLRSMIKDLVKPFIEAVQEKRYVVPKERIPRDFSNDKALDVVMIFLPITFLAILSSCTIWILGTYRSLIFILATIFCAFNFFFYDLHVFLVSFFVYFSVISFPSNSDIVSISFGTSMLLLGSFVVIGHITNFFIHMLLVGVLLILLSLALARLIGSKRVMDGIIGLHLISTVMLCSTSIITLIEKRAVTSLLGETILWTVRCMIPEGRFHLAIMNIFEATGNLVNYIESENLTVPPRFFFLLYIIGLLLLIIPRAYLGWFAISKLAKYKDVQHFAIGFYIYMIDGVKAPFMLINEAHTYFSMKHSQGRAVNYYFILCLFLYVEWNTARDLMFFRVVLTIYDIFFMEIDYKSSARFLDMNIDLHGIAFPKKGSLPWIDIHYLQTLVENTVKVTVGDKIGVGFKRRSGAETGIYTVDHVIRGADHLTLSPPYDPDPRVIPPLPTVHSIQEKVHIGHSDDPVVHVEIAGMPGGVEKLANLTISELPFVTQLFITNPEGPVVSITDFQYDLNRGNIYCTVDLKAGDSGSPVFAVLKKGEFRFCGCVSRGSFNEGEGNLISCVTTLVSIGSPGLGNYSSMADGKRDAIEAFRQFSALFEELATSVNDEELTDTAKKNRRATIRKRVQRIADDFRIKPSDFDSVKSSFDAVDIEGFNKVRQLVLGTSVTDKLVSGGGTMQIVGALSKKQKRPKPTLSSPPSLV